MFGSKNNSYTVTLEVKDTTKGPKDTTVVSKSGKYLSTLLGSYYGYEVLFDSAASLKMNTRYQIEALICGPASEEGLAGIQTVTKCGVTFTFATGFGSFIFDTTVAAGQFPEFLFSC